MSSQPPSNSTSTSSKTYAQLSVTLAQKSALVASWLPPPTASEIAARRPVEEVLVEEARLFAPVPQTLGVGYPIPEEYLKTQSSPINPSSSSSIVTNDALRRTLLGKQAYGAAKVRNGEMPVLELYSRKTARLTDSEDSDDGEDEVKGANGKRGRKLRRKQRREEAKQQEEEKEKEEENGDKDEDEEESAEPQTSSGFIFPSPIATESKAAKKRRRKNKERLEGASSSSVMPASSSSVAQLELLDGSVVPALVSSSAGTLGPGVRKKKRKKKNKKNNM